MWLHKVLTTGLDLQYVMAVAEKKGSLFRVLEYYQEQGANTNKIINKRVPKRAGDKSHQRKPRKEKTTFEANQ